MSVYEASIDDSDPQVLYSSGWVPVTQDGDWTGTMHSTSDIGSSARVRFTGSRVAVVCTIPTGDGQLSQASFSLDNAPAVNMAHKTTPPVQWQTVFWDSGPLPLASHLLVITNTGNQAYFRLDHIDYDPTDSNAPQISLISSTIIISPTVTTNKPPTLTTENTQSSNTKNPPTVQSDSDSAHSSQSGSSGSSASSSAVSVSIETVYAATTINGSPAATQKSDADTSASNGTAEVTSTKPKSPGGIVGGAIGGVVVIFLLLLAVWLLRRKKRRALYLGNVDGSGAGPSIAPTPFSLDRASTELSSRIGTTGGEISRTIVSPSHSHSSSFSPSTNVTSMYATGTLSSPGSTSAYGEMSQLEHHNLGAWRGEGSASHGPLATSKHAEFLAHQDPTSVGAIDQEAPPPAYSADVAFSEHNSGR